MTTITHYLDPAEACRLAFAPIMRAFSPSTSIGVLYRGSSPIYSENLKPKQAEIVTKAS